MSNTLKINIHFGGGAELLFDKIKKREVLLPALNKYFPDAQSEKWTIKQLLIWIKENLLKERPELFLQEIIDRAKRGLRVYLDKSAFGESVRPGILVLVNDADWELLGELQYELQRDDNVMFISTLHGG